MVIMYVGVYICWCVRRWVCRVYVVMCVRVYADEYVRVYAVMFVIVCVGVCAECGRSYVLVCIWLCV